MNNKSVLILLRNVLPGLVTCILILALPSPVMALNFNDMTEEQQQILAPYEDAWSTFDTKKQEKGVHK